ncbi:MAG: aspartate--tRNA ligase [Candidatus Shikimatogenerans sp. JK-2022]|nr:aspartate--tRNA ligase [Candidatus Shikimatogenerans bostrichidophilus]
MYKIYNCGELRINDNNKKVILYGWIDSIREMKNKIFIDLRDFYGITQLIINKINLKFNIKNEYVVKTYGKVILRKNINYNIKTGNIEILVKKIKILNKSKNLPFNFKKKIKINKYKIFKYRYLYLRNNEFKNNLIKKSEIINIIRLYFIKKKFLEIETPFLVKSTSEGARNFIIPSRKKIGYFYSLPQSPQTFKQLLMIGGISKYYQIVKCFRDEDLRKDRQTEFLQLDIEISFLNIKKILFIISKFIKFLFYKIKKIKLLNIKILSYKKILKNYNNDKPDLRKQIFKLNLKNKYFKKKNNIYLNLILPNFLNINNLINIKKNIYFILKKYIKYKYIYIYNFKNNIKNKKIFKNNNIINKIIKKNFFTKYDILLILKIKNKNYIKNIIYILNNFLLKSKYSKIIDIPYFIYKYPLFKYNIKKKKIESYHHPFTKPYNKNFNKLNINNINKYLSYSYDLIINGKEIGSGSIRIKNKNMQIKIFKLLGLSKKKIKEKFGYFLKALEYGTPPHGGIGIGIDRLILILLNKKDIKEIIAFPKNFINKDLMIGSPSKINYKKLLKLGIKIIKNNK